MRTIRSSDRLSQGGLPQCMLGYHPPWEGMCGPARASTTQNIYTYCAEIKNWFMVEAWIDHWMYFFGQPRGHKTNEVNHALEATYIASALLQGSWNMATRVRLLWKLASRLPKEVQGLMSWCLTTSYYSTDNGGFPIFVQNLVKFIYLDYFN